MELLKLNFNPAARQGIGIREKLEIYLSWIRAISWIRIIYLIASTTDKVCVLKTANGWF